MMMYKIHKLIYYEIYRAPYIYTIPKIPYYIVYTPHGIYAILYPILYRSAHLPDPALELSYYIYTLYYTLYIPYVYRSAHLPDPALELRGRGGAVLE